MDNIYTVIRIDEPDFGCEGLPDGAVYKDIVRIKDSSKSVLARDLGDCRDNLRNSRSVFLIVMGRDPVESAKHAK